MTALRRFHLRRNIDITGVSGTGIVAAGVLLPTGRAVLEWGGAINSITIHQNMEQLASIHSHDGNTEIVWDDDAET